ncbi:hypothetical protein Poly51_40040 [Rubripirellula tenax]|uniref:Uncharacterized protein n=1 Tax=Rubripirellula tenax TaxID=2528015 RepID=A0A5C6ETP9_9BACT|nr:hypothetical protein Poly51_40040 [Rubripirellula tenax]
MLTGWNHHGPGVAVVCLDCGQQIDLTGRPESEFGPNDEPCDVRLVFESPDAPEGVDVGDVVGAAVIRSAALDQTFGIIPTSVDLQCPRCDSANLAAGLADGTSCPSCKTGTISHGGSAIY